MSFFTALTGLKGAQTDISTTSNNIANVGSAGFKKSRAEFGDIFSTTPLQTNLTGSGVQQKSITQQFSQGNIAQNLFFKLFTFQKFTCHWSNNKSWANSIYPYIIFS